MNDDRVAASRSFIDASPSLFLVDTRASQSLEPIRLPAKLRDRIDRAQRRANAAKDGVSIFTKGSKDSAISAPTATVRGRATTAPTAETSTAATLGDMVDAHRAWTVNGVPDDKMHLPDVVLSHKMRDFEARANTGGGVALFSVEPADRSLQKLSLEDRERVMLAMQTKIRQIASDVDANFARITKALDANGIFDSAANIQRAQTLCLVDLQRRCKLDKLRDEAMREVLHARSQKSAAKPSHKLSQLMRPSPRARSAETTSSALPSTTERRKLRVSKLPALRTTSGRSSSKRSTKSNQRSHSPLARQLDSGNNDGDTKPDMVRMLTRRGGIAPPPPAATSQLVAREEAGFNPVTTTNASSNEGELYTRHPHVAQVLQLLAAGEASNNKTAGVFNANSAEADMEHARTLDPADEWTQRSPSYQAIGARATESVRRCGERQRWDTLGHFGSCSGFGCISAALRQRLEDQRVTWGRGEDTPRSVNGSDAGGAPDAGKGSSNLQQRDGEIYAELQARIRERLIANERRTRTAAAAVRVVGTSGRTRQATLPHTAPGKMVAASSSTACLPAGGTSPFRGSPQLPLQAGVHSRSLGVSASEPVLARSMAIPETQSASPLRHSQLGSRVRMSVLEHKLTVDPSQSIARHGRRKESLIGAPPAHIDSKAIGHRSEARIAYRRDTAQTWAWHVPPGTNSGNGVDSIAEEDEERSEDKDRFDDDGCDPGDEDGGSEAGEEGDDGTEFADDDAESVDSSRTSFSARSSMSMSSVKRTTSNGNRKHGKSKRPPAVQRRASRGPAGRSAGNTLTGHALSLHARLEVIWRVLQFPFSNKLTMLERLSTLQDADAFVSALEHWERVTPLVAIRQRMKLALSGYAERGELRPNEWLTPSELALVSALPTQPASVSESSSDAMPPLKTSLREADSMSPSAFVDWVRKHIDVVTLQTQKLADDLKAHTGEELQFQGRAYPRRG
ncbi:hypothetical protein PHYPSEUDO_012421 [Phytophthora pseudosyringae]|uniref:Uncharacterized protein n=1 Tax=Phytophthora pseudosyringae TaxID=221518 RepID=A0A8T1WI57_9STRA|nr:hypothetical protein PHYPSEUDO_012421 [Phytophthora pseudosyringae]